MKTFTNILFGTSLILAVFLSPFSASAGLKLDFLKKETRVNLEYDYSELKAGYGKCLPEQEFIAKQVGELNAKIPGSGDTWKSIWPAQRVITWEPNFMNTLNKHLAQEKPPLEFGKFSDARYTLILKVTEMKLHEQNVVFAISDTLTSEAIFVESNNRTNVVAKINVGKVDGVALFCNPDINGTYWKTGLEISKIIKSKAR